jgi:hypothetical protein
MTLYMCSTSENAMQDSTYWGCKTYAAGVGVAIWLQFLAVCDWRVIEWQEQRSQ